MNVSTLRLSLVLIASVILAVASGPLAIAEYHIGNSYFRGTPNGNFSFISAGDRGSNSITGSVMPNWGGYDTLSGGGALGTGALGIVATDSNYDKKLKFYNFLVTKNQGVGVVDAQVKEWERTGSALIVHQMLGRAQVSSGWGDAIKTITNAEWADLKARFVDNDKIFMERGWVSQLDHENTAGIKVQNNGVGGYNVYDAIRYQYEQSDVNAGLISEYVDSWVIRSGSGPGSTIVYQAEIICANPLGKLGGLPPPPQQEYSLNPSTTLNKQYVEPDESVSVTNQVVNEGSDPSEPTTWRLTRMVYTPSANLTLADMAGEDGPNDPCGSFPSANRSACDTIQESPNEIFAGGATKTFAASPQFPYTIPITTTIGTKFCFTVSVSRPTQASAPVWRHDPLQCVTVGKKPKLQIWGADIRVGGDIETSTSTFSSRAKTFGSWGEYGSLSNGKNCGFATSAGLFEGNASNLQANWSKLTLANTGTGGLCPLGFYNYTSFASSVVGQYVSDPSLPNLSGAVNLGALSAAKMYRATNLTITGSSIPSGKSVIIIASGTVTIDGNITYSNTLPGNTKYTNISDIPQVVIKASTINIKNSVTNVDSWLIASNAARTGTINTCWDTTLPATADLTTNLCNNPLKVNGPMVTDRLYLKRTSGAFGSTDAALQAPAEIFNLRADAFLWGKHFDRSRGQIRTVYSKELPPRL